MTADDATLIAALLGVLIPLIVGIITKASAPAGLKAFMNAGLTGVGGLLAVIVPGTFMWRVFLVKWATVWVTSVATYYGLWKPSGIAPAVQSSTASVGLG